ncbi:MAG TPA: hypothetical protein VN669_04255 [Candidatus Acidoferrales bacterium]|nr:hypothetical protein [Candidatus Acidoferrales bacterium]
MLWPDYKQFAALAKDATLVPVARTVAADLRTPVSAFLSIAAASPTPSCSSPWKAERKSAVTLFSARALI